MLGIATIKAGSNEAWLVGAGNSALQRSCGSLVRNAGTERFRLYLHPIVAVYSSFYSVSQSQHVEVNEKAYADAAEPQVGKNLSFVEWMDGINGLYFDHNSAFDNQIDSIPNFQSLSFIDNR